MNRSLYYRYFNITSRNDDYYENIKKELALRRSTEMNVNSIIELIYSQDEFTHLPIGDISMYLSSSARPEVKQFILDNLQYDLRSKSIDSVSSELLSSGQISSDDILYLTRSSDERREDYLSRVYDYISHNKKNSHSEINTAD